MKLAACGSLKIQDAKIAICTPSHNFVNPLAVEIGSLVWGSPQRISTGFESWQRYYMAL